MINQLFDTLIAKKFENMYSTSEIQKIENYCNILFSIRDNKEFHQICPLEWLMYIRLRMNNIEWASALLLATTIKSCFGSTIFILNSNYTHTMLDYYMNSYGTDNLYKTMREVGIKHMYELHVDDKNDLKRKRNDVTINTKRMRYN